MNNLEDMEKVDESYNEYHNQIKEEKEKLNNLRDDALNILGADGFDASKLSARDKEAKVLNDLEDIFTNNTKTESSEVEENYDNSIKK